METNISSPITIPYLYCQAFLFVITILHFLEMVDKISDAIKVLLVIIIDFCDATGHGDYGLHKILIIVHRLSLIALY